MKKIISTFFILLTFSLVSYAHFETGNTLYQKLIQKLPASTELFGDKARAVGYVVGVYDAFENIFWSSPPGLLIGQVTDIAIKYLKEHPEERHQPAVALLVKAFSEAFPIKKEGCEKGRGK